MEELYEEGKIKAIGVCNFEQHHLETLMKETKVTPAVNQIEVHPLFRST
jgi:diketogulonate reductase-like aldo/keto reductase